MAITNDNQHIISGSIDGIRYWDIKTGKELKKFVKGNKDNWVVLDNITHNFLRWDDGTFFLKKKLVNKKNPKGIAYNKTSILPSNLSKKDYLILKIDIKALEIFNNDFIELNVTVSNEGNDSYWIL